MASNKIMNLSLDLSWEKSPTTKHIRGIALDTTNFYAVNEDAFLVRVMINVQTQDESNG
ncbi:hypothetical protein MY3296_004054 [Beauveria thailandica]